jgi:hypothetical protein
MLVTDSVIWSPIFLFMENTPWPAKEGEICFRDREKNPARRRRMFGDLENLSNSTVIRTSFRFFDPILRK